MHPKTPAQLEAEIQALRERILALERRASELERAEESAKALAEVGRELAGTLDVAQATDRVVSTALRLFRVRRAVLYQLDRDSGALVCVAAAGEGSATNWIGCTLPPGAGVAGMAVAAGRTVWSADLIRDTRITLPDWAVERLRQEGYRSVVGIPLTFQGEIVGALVLADSVGRVFTDLDVRFLAAVAVQAALAVRNALLYDETQHRLRHTETLLAVSQAVSATLDATEAMRRVARETARTLGADMAIAYLLEPDHDRLRPIAGYHVPKPMLDRLSRFLIPLRGYRFVEEAWEYRRPFHSSDPGSDPRIDRSMLEELPCRSLLFVPMIVKGEPIGALLTTWQGRSHEFHAEELRLVEGISHQAALALDNARLFASQQEEAEISGALLSLAEAVSGVQNLEDVLDTVARITPQLLGRKRCGLFLFDAS